MTWYKAVRVRLSSLSIIMTLHMAMSITSPVLTHRKTLLPGLSRRVSMQENTVLDSDISDKVWDS
jgi:hypothetical protein